MTGSRGAFGVYGGAPVQTMDALLARHPQQSVKGTSVQGALLPSPLQFHVLRLQPRLCHPQRVRDQLRTAQGAPSPLKVICRSYAVLRSFRAI